MRNIKKHFKQQIKERFIYSWVISLILGSLITAACICAMVIIISFTGSRYNGQPVDFWGVVVVVFSFILWSIAFVGALLFGIGSLMGDSGCTTQMILCGWGLWPKPKKLRKARLDFGSFMDYN